MSGVSTRLLMAIAALRSGKTTLDGHSSLRARTNEALIKALVHQGCTITAREGNYLPVTVRGPLHAGREIQVAGTLSSQYVSALLLVGPVLGKQTRLQIDQRCVSKPYIDMTMNEMQRRGAATTWIKDDSILIHPDGYRGGFHTIEGDASAATYHAALATIHGGKVHFTNLGRDTCQGDYGFFKILKNIGANVSSSRETTTITGPKRMKGLGEVNLENMPDAALTLMTMAPLLPCATHITGLASLHHKECDRLEGGARELCKFGVKCEVGTDFIHIKPLDPSILSETIDRIDLETYNDHRMAMAFSVLASRHGNCHVYDPEVVGKTYPDYWQDYRQLVTGS